MTDAKTKAATMFAGLKGRFDAACAKHAPDPIKTARFAAKVQKVAKAAVDITKTATDIVAKPTTLGAGVAAASWVASKVEAEALKRAKFKPPGTWRTLCLPWNIKPMLEGHEVPETPDMFLIDNIRVWQVRPSEYSTQIGDVEAFKASVGKWLWSTRGDRLLQSGSLQKESAAQRGDVSPQTRYVWSRVQPFVKQNVPRSILLDGRPGTGKSTMARHIAEMSGDRSLRVDLADITTWFRVYAEHVVSILRPNTIIIDDLDRLGSDAIGLLDTLEKVRPPLLIVTTNNMNSLDPAIVRPGRFDELFTIDSLGAAYYRQVLGEPVWTALSAENQAKVETWPAAFLNELRLRQEHLPDCNVNAEFAALASRVVQNARPTWATTTMTAVPTTPHT